MSKNNNEVTNKIEKGKKEMDEGKSNIIIINNEKTKKKFKDTKFAKFVSKNRVEIISVAVGLGAGAFIGDCLYKYAKKTFDRGFWSGYVLGGADVVSSLSETEGGKEALTSAYGKSSEELIHYAETTSSAFSEYVDTHDIGRTVDFEHGLRVPVGKKLHRGHYHIQ